MARLICRSLGLTLISGRGGGRWDGEMARDGGGGRKGWEKFKHKKVLGSKRSEESYCVNKQYENDWVSKFSRFFAGVPIINEMMSTKKTLRSQEKNLNFCLTSWLEMKLILILLLAIWNYYGYR